MSKVYVASDGVFAGGDYQDGWVTGRVNDLGAYFELAYDDEGPDVTPSQSGGSYRVETDRQQEWGGLLSGNDRREVCRV